ncbi:hypothetical protein SPONL_902 [uncultured Candidatus Thioglobus sp.]|nr:hypothetical protein SPONL_902 [uncultured Candidatus Thioglobus sp.]
MKLGKSEEFIADYLNENVEFIADIEKGVEEVSLFNLSKLGKLYDLDLMAEVDNILAKKKKIKSTIKFSSVLGGLINIKRRGYGMSQEQLAKEIQLTRLTLSKIENGDANISAQKLAYLDNIFKSELMQEAKEKIEKLKEQQNVEILFDEDDKKEKKDNTTKVIAGVSVIAALFALLR